MRISIDQIDADPAHNLRIDDDPDELATLIKSIERDGLLQPLVVAERGDRFRLVCGFRRFQAVKSLGWETVVVSIVAGDDDALLKFTFAENANRADLNCLEEAVALERLFPEYASIRHIASVVGKSPNWVLARQQLRRLPKDIQRLFARGEIPISKVMAVLRSENKREACQTIMHNRRVRSHKSYKTLQRQRRRTMREMINMNMKMMESGLEGLATLAIAWAAGYQPDDVLLAEIERSKRA